MERTKNILPWLLRGLIVFLIACPSFHIARTRAQLDRKGFQDSSVAPGRKGSPSHRSARASGREQGATQSFVRVPPGMFELFNLLAFDPDTGTFTDEFTDLLELSDLELSALSISFHRYYAAFAQAELKTAQIIDLSREQGSGPPVPNRQEDYLLTVRLEPLGQDRLATELATLRRELSDGLGRSRGLLATALISSQLGNAGKGGELVSFIKYKHDPAPGYRLRVEGLADHNLRAGVYVGGTYYHKADLTLLMRYKHLASLAK